MTFGTDKPLTLDVRELPSAAVVAVGGAVDMQDAERLRAALEELTGREVPIIILDLSEMNFISSMGLGAIITAHLKTRHYQGSLRLANPQPAVHQLLETTRLTKLFNIYDDVDQALAGIGD